MRRTQTLLAWVVAVGVAVAAIGGHGPAPAQAADPQAGTLTGGGALGFLANTPDDTAFALNLNFDYHLNHGFSVGPLLQLGFTGDMTLTGLSGQTKYWLNVPDTGDRGKLVLQAGLGFVHADFLQSDTSWLIPLGIGFEYALDRRLAVTATFLLNFTDLDTGGGRSTNVMPGLTFGVRF
jgi:Outer membrane protein beta-barrel domain